MLRSGLLSFILLISSVVCLAQTAKHEKKLQKAKDLLEKNEVSKSLETLEELTEEAPGYGAAWDELSKLKMGIYYYRLSKQKEEKSIANFSIKNADGTASSLSKNDSLMQVMQLLMDELKPSKLAYNDMIKTMRTATLVCDDAESSAMLLRNFLVDPKVDTAVSEKAKELFSQAEEEFRNNNFGKAAELYQKAIDVQPDYFKASLYLGDSYYGMHNYLEAINYFKRAIERFPTMLEPRKYLSDAYSGEGLYKEAIEEGIKALCVYPDVNMLTKVRQLMYEHERKRTPGPIKRYVFPFGNERSAGEIYGDGKEDKKLKMLKKEAAHWEYYMAAGTNLKDNYTKEGINRTNQGQRYLEIACWEEMLKFSKAPELELARSMQAIGMLDCYVFITCFHQDFYPQFKDFASTNSEKIKLYFEKSGQSY